MDYSRPTCASCSGVEDPNGVGLALIAICHRAGRPAEVFAPRVHAGAIKYLPVLRAEQRRLWPAHPDFVLLAGLVE